MPQVAEARFEEELVAMRAATIPITSTRVIVRLRAFDFK
jgi:hypothetical protein